jgi:transcriptional regulator with XRE-family HTH domain
MNETTNLEAIVVNRYRTSLRMSYRTFADALNKHLVNTSVTYMAVMNWEKGINEPSTDFLLICLVVYPRSDWRNQFAMDALVAKLPEVFERYDGGLRILSSAIS